MLLAVLLALAGVVLALVLGGGSSPTAAELGQRRAHLVFVTDGLLEAEGEVRRELRTTTAAWPSIAHGLPAHPGSRLTVQAGAARSAAEAMASPKFVLALDELAGPATGIARLFNSSQLLLGSGWEHISAALDAPAGSAAARFLRANCDVYIESIYQGVFDLSEIGERLEAAYVALGGAKLFGSSLTLRKLKTIVSTYSPSVQLEPHAVLAPESS